MNEHLHEHGSALPGASYPQALSRFATRYFTFTGRASRSEFWWWLLTFVVVSIVLALLNKVIMGPTPSSTDPAAVLRYAVQTSVLQLAWAAVNFIGAVAVTVRRLHDIGRSGWWWFIQLVPLLGSVAMVVMVAMPPTPAGNRFDREPLPRTQLTSAA